MITRRTAALAAAGLMLAPTVVRAGSLMRLRGDVVVVPPVEPVYLGFVDRLRLYHEHGLVLPARVYSEPSLFAQAEQVREGRRSLPTKIAASLPIPAVIG